jgi:hypothetical protein
MLAHRLIGRISGLAILLVLLSVLVAACSIPFISTSPSSSSTTSTTSAAACPSPMPFQTVSGTIQSINGTTLVVASSQGSTIQATYTSTTRFTRQAKVTAAALKEGAFVFVAVTQNTSNAYTATTISLMNSGGTGSRPRGAFGGFGGRGNSACGGQGRRFAAGGGVLGTGNGNGNARGIRGTISQLSGNTLTVTDSNQSDYTIALNSATQIIQTSQVSAASLQVGMRVTLVGLHNAQGQITAQAVTILLPSSAAK